MKTLLRSAGGTLCVLLMVLAGGCNTRTDITCSSCPNWRYVSSAGCAEIATQLNCESQEVKAREDGACADGLICVLTGCDDDDGTGEVCAPFAKM